MEAAVILVAVLGHLPTLGSWWNLDDWGLLGRAAGLSAGTSPAGFPARFLSQHLYWDLAYPLFGLSPAPYAWTRLLLHGLAAWLVTRIAWRAGLRSWQRLVAGLVLAASPLAFTPLYWAAGIQELLAGCLALLAVERWLAAGRRNLVWAVFFAVLSLLAKESGLGLPLLFLVFLWLRIGFGIRDKAFAWALVLLLLLAAMSEGVLVVNHFASGPDDPYATGGAGTVLANLGVFGWWLMSPGPVLAGVIHWPMAAAGMMFFLGWAAWGTGCWRQGNRLPVLALGAVLLVLGPALPLARHIHPYLAYLATAPVGLALGSLDGGRRPVRWPFLLPVALLAVAWSFWSMETRLGQRDSHGLPADPVVRATSLSWQVCRELTLLPLDRGQAGLPTLTLLQIPATDSDAALADQLGDRWVAGTHLYEALGGATGPRLVLTRHSEQEVRVDWVNALFSNPPDALVLCAAGPGFKHWGNTANAAFFAALTDVGMGRFERARRHLLRAAQLQRGRQPDNETASFFFDPDQMVIPMERILDQKEAFIDWTLTLLADGHSPQEVGGLQDTFLELLVAATGRSREELTAGSRLLGGTAGEHEPRQPVGE